MCARLGGPSKPSLVVAAVRKSAYFFLLHKRVARVPITKKRARVLRYLKKKGKKPLGGEWDKTREGKKSRILFGMLKFDNQCPQGLHQEKKRRRRSLLQKRREGRLIHPCCVAREETGPKRAEGPELHKVVRCVPVRTCLSIAPHSLREKSFLTSCVCAAFLISQHTLTQQFVFVLLHEENLLDYRRLFAKLKSSFSAFCVTHWLSACLLVTEKPFFKSSVCQVEFVFAFVAERKNKKKLRKSFWNFFSIRFFLLFLSLFSSPCGLRDYTLWSWPFYLEAGWVHFTSNSFSLLKFSL